MKTDPVVKEGAAAFGSNGSEDPEKFGDEKVWVTVDV